MEDRVRPWVWVAVTLLVAVIGCSATIGAAFVSEFVDRFFDSGPQLTVAGSPTRVDRDPAGATSPPPVAPTEPPPAVPTATLVPWPTRDQEQALLATQSDGSTVPAAVWEGVANMLTNAVSAEILAYRTATPAYASNLYSGAALDNLTQAVQTLTEQGLFAVPEFDFGRSRFVAVRMVATDHLEVDACEYWRTHFYQLGTGLLVQQGEEFILVPQTITIELQVTSFGPGWFITAIEFYDPPYFC